MYEDARFALGEAVQLLVDLRNDGSHTGLAKGQVMMPAGSRGTVCDIGLHLNRSLIYRVDFFDAGLTMGCREVELQAPLARLLCALRHDDRLLAESGSIVTVVEPAERAGHWRIALAEDVTVIVPAQALQWLPPPTEG